MYLTDLLKLSTERIYTDEGFLSVPAKISRVGTQTYTALEMGLTDRPPTDIIVVFRPAEEVFAAESLASFANKPVTDNHPAELVNPDNIKKHSVGHSGPEVTRDGDFAKTILHVTHADAIAKIESGKVELSNGYTADIDWTPGVTPTGEHFDAVQRNIKGNHIAIVERGRAGPACRVADKLPEDKDKVIMAKITIDGVDYEVDNQAAQAVGKLQARLMDTEHETEEAEKKAKDAEEEAEEAKKKAKKSEDSLQAKLDDANSKLTPESLDKAVTDRTAIVDAARKVMPEIKWEGKDADTLRKEVVAAKCPNVQMDSVSPDYVSARFDILLDAVSTNRLSVLDNALIKQVKNKDGTIKDTRSESTIARDKMIEDGKNAWKSKGEKN